MLMRLLVSIVVLALASPSWAAFTLVRANCDNALTWTGAGSDTLTWTYATAAPGSNNLSLFAFVGENRYLNTAAGSGMTYTRVGSVQNNAAAGFQTTLLQAIGNGSDTTATLTLSGGYGGADSTVCYLEFSGNDTDQSTATANGAVNNAVTAHPSGSVTPPTAANVVVSSTYISGGVWTGDGAFTELTTGDTWSKVSYLIQAAATAQEYNGSTDVNRYSAMAIGAFAGTAGSTPTTNYFRLRVNP